MKTQSYDLIGDIHGWHNNLTAFSTNSATTLWGDGFRHPEGRRVIYLGDYVDRGPKVREVVLTVRAMVEAGDALAIMGNHEYNAVCYHAPDSQGGWLRQRNERTHRRITATLRSFEGREAEWSDWLEWMKHLPMSLDLGELRCVHACWDAAAIQRLKDRSLADSAFLRASATSR